MTKVAVFVEGQGEQILARTLVLLASGYSGVHVECVRLCGDTMKRSPFTFGPADAAVFYLIVDVGNDERVVSAINEREGGLAHRGYQVIIGLRDLYSRAYDRRSGGRISAAVTKEFLDGARQQEASPKHRCTIRLFFAIMELEAWFFGMPGIFRRIHSSLTENAIARRLGIRLCEIDPQVEFYRPAKKLEEVFSVAGERYSKTRDQLEGICSAIGPADVEELRESGRCQAFAAFHSELVRHLG